MRKSLILIVLAGLLFVLLGSISEMPGLGGLENPSYNEVPRHYLEHAIDDTNTANVIASIITDYRAFDTLGETTVLFTSITAVISVLGSGVVKFSDKEEKH